MNKQVNGKITEKDILENPYNYSLNEMISVMEEERAKSFFKNLGSITFSVCLMVTGYVRHP